MVAGDDENKAHNPAGATWYCDRYAQLAVLAFSIARP